MKTYRQLITESEGSAKTSRNFLPGGFKKVHWQKGTSNFDIGGGKYEKGTDFLAKKGVTNLVYDPYNRSNEHNDMTWDAGEEATTATIFNVLNVVPSRNKRIKLMRQAKRGNIKTVYITAYKKDGDSIGRKTRDGWQNNMPLEEYLPEVQSVFGNGYIKDSMIIANV